jgi:hypothetical protein
MNSSRGCSGSRGSTCDVTCSCTRVSGNRTSSRTGPRSEPHRGLDLVGAGPHRYSSQLAAALVDVARCATLTEARPILLTSTSANLSARSHYRRPDGRAVQEQAIEIPGLRRSAPGVETLSGPGPHRASSGRTSSGPLASRPATGRITVLRARPRGQRFHTHTQVNHGCAASKLDVEMPGRQSRDQDGIDQDASTATKTSKTTRTTTRTTTTKTNLRPGHGPVALAPSAGAVAQRRASKGKDITLAP